MYGGDEVNAIVLDVQSNTTRAGYAGEDTPKSVIPSSYGYIPPDDASNAASGGRYHFGYAGPTVYRGAEQQVLNPLRDSIVEDWDAAERLVEHAFKSEMRLNSLDEHPLLTTEPAWNPKSNRERMIELAFEGWDVPAFYSVDRAVLSGFSSGKGTALVVDIGEETTSITPVHDGFVLRKGIQKSPLTGSLLSSLLQSSLSQNNTSATFTPSYKVKSRSPVELGQPPNATLYSPEERPATDSFAAYNSTQTLHEFKESICGVLEGKWDDNVAMQRGGAMFEFPDGFKAMFGPNQRYRLPDVFFRPSQVLSPEIMARPPPPTHASIPTPSYTQAASLQELIKAAIQSCDADVQPALMSNIVVVGGTSLLPGFVERLNSEVAASFPASAKVRVSAAGSTVERRFSSWVGGSILASLGTFHQLWISKQEYAEQGKSIIHRRAR